MHCDKMWKIDGKFVISDWDEDERIFLGVDFLFSLKNSIRVSNKSFMKLYKHVGRDKNEIVKY